MTTDEKFSVSDAVLISPSCGSDVAGGLDGYEILKLHDADPFLGVELKFMDIIPCRRFLDSYTCGSLLQFLSQHASRLLSLPNSVGVEATLKAGTHTLDHSLQDPELCLQLIYQSQVHTHSLCHLYKNVPFFYSVHYYLLE